MKLSVSNFIFFSGFSCLLHGSLKNFIVNLLSFLDFFGDLNVECGFSLFGGSFLGFSLVELILGFSVDSGLNLLGESSGSSLSGL